MIVMMESPEHGRSNDSSVLTGPECRGRSGRGGLPEAVERAIKIQAILHGASEP